MAAYSGNTRQLGAGCGTCRDPIADFLFPVRVAKRVDQLDIARLAILSSLDFAAVFATDFSAVMSIERPHPELHVVTRFLSF